MINLLKQINKNLKIRHRKYLKKQTPKFAVLTCSDSRVDAEDFFGDSFNKDFVIENAWNTANNNLWTIEYALKELAIKHFVVIWHSHCGACKYSFETKWKKYDKELDHEFKIIKKLAEKSKTPQELEIKNIQEQVKIIKKTFPEYAEKIVGMYYDIEKREVSLV